MTRGRARASDVAGVPAAVLVGGIALLVVLVSMPRFRAHAVAANRADARVALDILADVVFTRAWTDGAAAPEDPAEPEDLADVVAAVEMLRHRFPDARRAPDTGQLVHHGYRIDTGYLRDGVVRRPALVAWPDAYGRSGDAAFAITAEGALWGHPNGGRWSAGTHELVEADVSGGSWTLLRASRDD
ncbi:MAG: hypothetical protein AAGA20_16475 [Planctomycetota bacterium]